MSIEIELKAWADDPDGLRDRLFSFAGFDASFEKADSYWFFTGAGSSVPLSGVRIRKETRTGHSGSISHTLWVTYKVKEVREGMEINDEREFSVSDGAAFEELLRRLGLEKGIEKNKKGWAWICEGITVELTEVEGLGWFVELEIITDDDTNEAVTAARLRLLALLHKIGIKKDRIEPRYYTEMLREKAKPGPFSYLD
ncbi:MAG: class IV adenylate cyclase [Spirochaetaceae bacterium]|jgi:adenylate cyclase class 2|nr:class IV adenylate cyclase [Spirochaetaceae bacterium]